MPEVPPDGGILKVVAAGVCGADWHFYPQNAPARILGHENIGYIDKIGAIAAERWGVKEGDYVALEEYLPCGHCDFCRSGEFRLCEVTDARNPNAMRYGSTSTNVPPMLWGGYAQYMYLHPNSVLHPLPSHIQPDIAAMALPVGNGFQWALVDGGATAGQTVLVQGPGQQGLSCVLASKIAGAECVIATGLTRDAKRLEVAKAFGADFIIDVEKESLIERIEEITGGKGVDLVVDSAAGPGTLRDAILAVKKTGTIVMSGAPQYAPEGFPLEDIQMKRLTLRGLRGHSFAAVELAIQYLSAGKYPLHLMSSHQFGLDNVDLAIRSVGGEGVEGAIHVTVMPWGT
jgi:threonine dehydrogenase-like Zn-dependent dehydrogenase